MKTKFSVGMSARQKRAFIRELSDNIRDSLLEKVSNMPEEWDGHELRCLLAERHRQSASMSLIIKEPRGKRARKFNNTVLIQNL